MIDTHSLNMPDTSQEYCSNHQVTGRTYGQLLQFWLVHKTEKMSPKIRGKAEQKAVWLSQHLWSNAVAGSKFTHILTLIFSLAPGSDRIIYSAMEDKTCKIAGPHHTCWVLWALLYSITPILNVSNYKSWLSKDGSTWRFGNFPVCVRHGKTAFTLHYKLSPSFLIFKIIFVILEECIACNSDSGKQVLGPRELGGCPVKGTTITHWKPQWDEAATPEFFLLSVLLLFSQTEKWLIILEPGLFVFFLGIFQKNILATLSSFRAPALPEIRNKATTT